MVYLNKVFVVLLIFFSSYSQQFKVEKGQMVLEAKAETIGLESSFNAQGEGLSGSINLEEKLIFFAYDLWEIDTGIELRNDHMHENYLETEDFPEAVYKGKIIAVNVDTIFTKGTFTLHGVEKEINIFGILKENKLTAKWTLSLTDYNIEVPQKFIFAKLSEKLLMSIKAELKKMD